MCENCGSVVPLQGKTESYTVSLNQHRRTRGKQREKTFEKTFEEFFAKTFEETLKKKKKDIADLSDFLSIGPRCQRLIPSRNARYAAERRCKVGGNCVEVLQLTQEDVSFDTLAVLQQPQ